VQVKEAKLILVMKQDQRSSAFLLVWEEETSQWHSWSF